MRPSIRQLTGFLAVAESGSFTRAAERMRVAQPALSALVRKLEIDLGLPLFDRTTRRVELTEVGRQFRVAVARAMDELDGAVRHVRDQAQRKLGRLVVAAPPLLASGVVAAIIRPFQSRYPGVSIGIIDARTDHIISKVRSGEADCGIGTFPADADDVSRTILARDEIALFCRPDMEAAGHETVRWSMLAAWPLVTLTRDSGVRLLVERGFETFGGPGQVPFEVDHITTALALARTGVGLAVLPSYAGVFGSIDGLVSKRLVEPTITREISIIVAQGRSRPPTLQPFVDMLKAGLPAMVSAKARPPAAPASLHAGANSSDIGHG